MRHHEAGRRAEAKAAEYLQRQGCTLLAQNWRTRRCEIDLVVRRSKTVYFCEVKYRRHARQGLGLDYITPAKLRQMHFAARIWTAKYGWEGEWQLCAIEVTGTDFRITSVVKDLSS